MRAFITGGTGFVGRNVVAKLLKEGIEVYVNYRGKPQDIKNRNLKWIKIDLEAEEELKKALLENEIDVFVNLIGIIKEKGEQTFTKLHYDYPFRFIKASQSVGIKKYIQMSALGVGDGIKTGYFEYKEKAEEILINSRLKYSIIRPSMIFGEEDESINMFKNMIKTFHVFPLLSWGNYDLQPVSINEVAETFAKAVKGEYENKVVEIAGPKVYRFKELLKEIAKINKTFVLTFPLPDLISKAIAMSGDKLPFIPITSNMLKMLKAGNYLKPHKANHELMQVMGKERLS